VGCHRRHIKGICALTTGEKTAKKKPAAKRRKPRATAKPAAKSAAAGDQAQGVPGKKTVKDGIAGHGVAFMTAARRSWFMFAPAAFFSLLGAMFVVQAPAMIVIMPIIGGAISLVWFISDFKSKLMPVMVLEQNEQGDALVLRVYYAFKGDYGAQGKYDLFGKVGYCVDGVKPTELKAFDAYATAEGYSSTTPESLRYMCEHSASSEAYRRQSTTLKRDVINWMGLLGLVGIFSFLTFTIGSSVLSPTP